MAEAPMSPPPDTAGGDACGDVLTLHVLRGPQTGRVFRFVGHSTLFVGRGPGVHLALEGDRNMSRLHFCIEYKPPQARLTDANSKNKTYVNGQPVAVADLRNGDEIQAGETGIRVGLPVDDPNHTFACPETAPPPPGPMTAAFYTRPLAESTVPGYTIERELGRGGMGVVYQARRAADGQRVAIKTVLPTVAPRPDSVGRFQREVSILGRLDHPNIVRFHEAGEAGGLVYFVMEYVEGVSVSDLVKRDGALAPERGVEMGCQLLDALAHAHGQGFVHRDVKPGNLLLTDQGDREVLKLADFGLARAYQESALSGLTISGQAGGTAEFMPPEQVVDFHSARPAADQYAAAATIYYLLTGRHIYERAASMMEMLARILQAEPIPLRVPEPGLPGRVGPVICRALSRQPERRYPDARAMREALRKAL